MKTGEIRALSALHNASSPLSDQGLCQTAVTAKGGHAIDEGFYLGSRHGTLKAINGLALPESIDHRNGLNAQLCRDALVLINVDLDHAHFATCAFNTRLQRRAEGFAGAAPRRPEINDHGNSLTKFDHIGQKTDLSAVLDQIACWDRGSCCCVVTKADHRGPHLPDFAPYMRERP